MNSVQRLRNGSKHSCPRTVVLLHISYLDEPFVTESERLTCSTVDRELGEAGRGWCIMRYHECMRQLAPVEQEKWTTSKILEGFALDWMHQNFQIPSMNYNEPGRTCCQFVRISSANVLQKISRFSMSSESSDMGPMGRLSGLHTATLRFGYAEPLTAARFDLHAKLGIWAQEI